MTWVTPDRSLLRGAAKPEPVLVVEGPGDLVGLRDGDSAVGCPVCHAGARSACTRPGSMGLAGVVHRARHEWAEDRAAAATRAAALDPLDIGCPQCLVAAGLPCEGTPANPSPPVTAIYCALRVQTRDGLVPAATANRAVPCPKCGTAAGYHCDGPAGPDGVQSAFANYVHRKRQERAEFEAAF